MKKKLIEVPLTPEQWVEVYYCLDSKITEITNGDLGAERFKGEDKKWINELVDIMDEIETKVEV